jgi:hypothetical protein
MPTEPEHFLKKRIWRFTLRKKLVATGFAFIILRMKEAALIQLKLLGSLCQMMQGQHQFDIIPELLRETNTVLMKQIPSFKEAFLQNLQAKKL